MKNSCYIILFFCLAVVPLKATTPVGGVAGSLTVTNSIIYNDLTYSQIASTVTITNSAVRGSTAPSGTGNLAISSYSAFKEASVAPVDTFSYYLSPISVLTDVGSITSASIPTYMPSKDLNGNDRVYNRTIDIGAVEYSEVYTGSTQKWETAGDWNIGRIPTTDDIVTIHSATTVNTINAVCKAISSIDAGASLTINAGQQLVVSGSITNTYATRLIVKAASDNITPNGTLIFHNPQASPVSGTVEMYARGLYDQTGLTYNNITYHYSWQYFGIPINTVTAYPTFSGSYVRRWVESGTSIDTHWVSVNNAYQLQPGIGYELTQKTPGIITFQGPLVNWDLTISKLPRTTSPAPLFPGLSVLANPFTAAINVKNIVFGSDMIQEAYFYTTGSYGSFKGGKSNSIPAGAGQYVVSTPSTAGNSGIPAQIPSMQAILVVTNTNATDQAYVTLPYNTSSIVQNTTLQRSKELVDLKDSTVKETATDSSLVNTRIDVTGKNYSDKMWLFTRSGCTRTFDNGWDGVKIIGDAFTPQIFALEPDNNYQIDAVEDINNTILGFQAGEDKEYTLTFAHQNITGKYTSIFLVDLLENKTVDITANGSTYSFTAESTPAPTKRFVIATRNTKSDTPAADTQLTILATGNIVLVQNLSNQGGELNVYDMVGHFIKKATFGAYGVTAIEIGAIPGVYIAKAATATGKVSKKFIIGE